MTTGTDQMFDDMVERLLALDSADESQTVRVSADCLARLLTDNAFMRRQVSELQTRGTQLVAERQRMRDPERIQRVAMRTAATLLLLLEDAGEEDMLEHAAKHFARAYVELATE